MSPHPAALGLDGRCPCGSGDTLAACCARFLPALGGAALAPTAEALMRSRYTAFAVGDGAYLMASWHPDTRPVSLELDDDTRWLLLTIDAVADGGPFDAHGVVEFTASFRTPHGRGTQHERSRFVREDGAWLYVDGDVD